MHKTTYQFRLYPTTKQKRLMLKTLDECRWLYNHFLEERKVVWEDFEQSRTLYSQIKTLPALKAYRASLTNVHSQVLQNVAVRIDLAFKAFFRRVKSGEKPGYPRFRGIGLYDSFTYTQSGYSVGASTIRLAKIGEVKTIIHRPIEGIVKTCCIRRTSVGNWFVSLACEVEDDKPFPASDKQVGIDVGLESFAFLSTGDPIANPRFFRRDERDLVRAQRKLSAVEKGTPARAFRRKAVSHIHERIANRRKDFAHQLSRRLVNEFGVICVEDIKVNRMLHNRCLAKSISDASWSMFFNFLAYKAANAGRQYVAINPAYTTQDCSNCGHRQKLSLSERVYRCPCCSLTLSRDHNASLNILSIGLDTLGIVPRSSRL